MRPVLIALSLVCVSSLAALAADTDRTSDYPTSARADYVLGCMASNNQTRAALDHCSCSIDVIASILPFDKYEEAETILSDATGDRRTGPGVQRNQGPERHRRRSPPSPGGSGDTLLPLGLARLTRLTGAARWSAPAPAFERKAAPASDLCLGTGALSDAGATTGAAPPTARDAAITRPWLSIMGTPYSNQNLVDVRLARADDAFELVLPIRLVMADA